MFADPLKISFEFGFLPGQKVADFGSGTGHFSMALSRLLGPEGRVYAVDISKNALTRLKKIAEDAGRDNIDVLLGDIDDPKGSGLKTSSVDGVVLSNIFFQLEKPLEALKEAQRVVKPGGRICAIEWKDKFSEAELIKLAQSLHLSLHRRLRAGESHYGLIFNR